jgi:hypothetical protein
MGCQLHIKLLQTVQHCNLAIAWAGVAVHHIRCCVAGAYMPAVLNISVEVTEMLYNCCET